MLLTVGKSEVMNGVGECEWGDVWGLIPVLLKMYCKMWIPGYRKLRISLAKDSDIIYYITWLNWKVFLLHQYHLMLLKFKTAKCWNLK